MVMHFDREFADAKRRIARRRRLMSLMMLSWGLILIGAGSWVLTHPERIGAFFGRMAAGF